MCLNQVDHKMGQKSFFLQNGRGGVVDHGFKSGRSWVQTIPASKNQKRLLSAKKDRSWV